MDTRIKRVLSFAVAFFMVIGMMPVNVVRAEGTEGDGTEIVAETTAPETTPHVCEYAAVVTAPTCEAAGFTTYTCSCGDTYTADEVEATGHTYGEDDKCACGALNPAHAHSYTSVVTAPTCDAAGYTTNTCACGDVTTTDEVEATGHTYGENGKCACGALDPAHEHTYVEGKCVCGDERILMMSPAPSTEPTVKPCEEGCWMEEGHEGECEIICTKDERCVLEDGHEGQCEAFGGVALVDPTAIKTAEELAAAVAQGGEITLAENITLSETLVISEGKTVVLNLGGFTVTGTMNKSVGHVIKNDGTLTVSNGTITSSANNGGSALANNGTATVNAVTLNGAPNADGSWPSYTVNNASVMTIQDSKITSYHGSVASYGAGALVTLTNTNIDMAGIPGFTSHAIYTYNSGSVVVNSGVIVNRATDQNSTGGSVINGAVTVNGGEFNGRVEKYYGTPVIKAGTFKYGDTVVDVAKYVHEDSTFDKNSGVVSKLPVVAKIGNKEFTSLQKAIEKVAEGETIVLQKDITMTDGITITDKNITIDLNDYTFTVSEGASTNNRNIKINGTSVVTVKNGTLVAAGNYSSGAYGTIRTEGSADVTLTDLKLYNYRGNGLNVKAYSGTTVTMIDVEVYSEYGGGIEAAGGTIELTRVTVEQKGMYTSPYNSMAISVNGGGKVTVNSGSYTTVPLAADDANNQGSSHGSWAVGVLNSGGTLIINGGTFANGNFGDDALATHARGLINADTAANIQINGGTFNALQGVVDYLNNLGDASRNPVVTVKGGNYSANPSVTSYGSVVIPAGYEVLQENARYIVQWKTVEVTPPSDFVPDVSGEIASEDISKAVKKITEGIKSSNAVKEVSGLPKETTLSVKFVSASVEANENSESSEKVVTTKITYDVTPVDAYGNKVKLTDEITFRLPVPGHIYDHMDKAYVYHGNELLGVYDVKGTAPDRYVEVSAKDFSEYAIELIDVSDADVAQIGAEGYATLQAAVNAVKNNETITLIKDCDENVTLNEKAGLYYTIDGNEKTMTGTITINALSNTDNNRCITIKNINFVDAKETSTIFIASTVKNHYPHIMVENCDFTGTGYNELTDEDVAINVKSSSGVIIKNCTGTGLHSFLQNNSGWNLTIEGVTVTDSKSAFALGTVQGVTVRNCNITAGAGYGVRLDAQYDNNAVIENCQISAFIPVVVRKASVESHITIAGTNTLTETNTDGFKIAIGTSEYEKNGTLPTATTGRVIIKVDDAALAGTLTEESYQSIMAGAVQKCGNKYLTIAADAIIGAKYYDKLSEAVAAGGNVVVLKDIVLDAPIEIGTNVTLTAEEPVTITATGDAFTVKENASLTIGRNITIDASITASGENAVLSVTEGIVASAKSEKGGKINVIGGTVDKAIAGQNGIVTISGGNIESVELLAGASKTSAITGGNIGTVTSADVKKFVSGGIFENEVAQKYLNDGMECVMSADKFIVKKKVVFAAAYTTNRGIYGEAEHIVAYDSFTMDLYDADGNLIATSELVDKADGSSELLDGYVELITWNILLPGNTDSWWNTQWADTHPRADVQPAKVVLKADGVKVGEANVQMNAPDNLNPVKWPELDGVNTIIVTHTDNTQSAYTDLDIALNATVAGDKVHICTDAKVNNDVTASSVSITAEAGKSITIPIGKTLNLTDSTMKVDKVIVEYTKNVGSGTFNIAGETTLIIPELTGGGEISLLNETIIVDSTVGGDATLYGKVIFRGDNTFNMIYDYGDAYSETSAEWIVEAESSLTLNTKARYGLGYGDKGSVYGSLNNARTARGSLTDADISFFTHGLVAMSNWDVPNVFTVKDAYVVIGSNNSFGNSKSHTGSYEFLFENSVLDASRITFYEAASTTNFRFVDSDVKVGQFMTRDADSIFTMVNTRFVSTATSNGTDEGNYHAGTMLLRNSSLSYSAPLVVENGTITMDAESMLTAPALNGTGKIVIDTSKMTRTEKVQVISGATANTLTIEAGNASVEIAETGIWVYFDTFVDKNGNGTFDAGEGYGTLEAAVAAAEDGQTIYILHDVDLNEQVVVEKDITITAQESKKVSANFADAIVVKNGATLTLGKNVEFDSEICANGGAVVVDGATISASVDAQNGGTITVNSGTAKTVSATGANVTLNVTGGTVVFTRSENGAQINVSGGTVGSVIANEKGIANISTGKITNVNATGAGAVITITGGEISGTVVAADGGKILIIGGWFKNNPSKDGAELAKGMIWDEKTGYIVHGSYVAFIDENDNGIFDDGETGFESITEAVAAENETVKLLNNLTTDAITIEKSVTIDLNGYKTAAVTVKSGNAAMIDSSDNTGYGIDGEIIVETGAGLELLNVKTGTVKASGKLTIGEGAEVENISASTGADVIITDGIINNGISVLGGAVTIKGGRINGEITIEENADENASIAIFSGIFSKPVPAEYCADGYIPVDYKDGTYGVELSVVRYINLSKVADGKIKAGDVVYIDGDAYPVGADMTVEIPNAVAKKSVLVLTTYTYKNAGQAGAYPTAMYVWLVKGDKNVDGDDIYDTFKTERVSALDNFFKYEGTSIRVGNAKNGIRFFTSVHAGNANKLMQGKLITSGNLAGVKMVSAGTEFWKTADNKLRSEVYGGKVGNTFRVFQIKDGRNWFTGVLTGLDTDAATIKETINTRPYAQLKLGDGTVVTLYGGTLGRSILYVATQNQNTFKTGTASDNFIEGLIAKGSK